MRRLSTWARALPPLTAFAVLGLALRAGGSSGPVERPRRELEKIEAELSEKKREKTQTDRRARVLAEEVDRISGELEAARRALTQTESRLAEAEERRSSAESRLWASREILGRWQDRLASALSAHYRRGVVAAEGAFLPLVYEQALLTDQITRLSFALEKHQDAVVARDELMVAEERLRGLKLERTRDEGRLESARARLKVLQRTAEGRKAVLERDIRALGVSAKRFERKVLELIAEQKADEARRAARAKRAPEAPPAVGEIAKKWRGKIPWPVAGPVVEKFGRSRHPELNTYVFSNGVMLRPSANAAVAAVAEGEVLFAGPFMNYGLMVLVGHPDNWHSLYAHLGQLTVARGQPLRAGVVVGRPGRDDRGRPTVYFEIRAGGSPVDPEAWIR